MFLFAKHAVTFHAAQSVIIHTVDSDIAIYSLYFQPIIRAEIYIKIGVKERTRIILNFQHRLRAR